MPDGGMVEVAKATVTIIPNMKGAQASISKELNSAMGSTGQTAGAKLGTSMSGAASKILIASGIGAAVGTALKMSYDAWNELNDAMDIVTAKTGATGDALEDMQKRAQSIATSIPTDFETSAEAIGELNTRFGLMGDDLEGLAAQFVKFAEINDTDVSSSIDGTQKAMAALGVDISDASGFLDLLNAAGQNTGIDMGTLTKELVANASALQQMGLSAEESVSFIANLDKSGTESATVLTGLKKALVSATKEGMSMDEALADVQDRILNASSETEGLSAAMELFGNKAGPAMYNAITQGAVSLTDFASNLGGFEGSVDSAFDEVMDPMDKFTAMLNSLKLVGAEAFSALLTIAEPVLDFLTKALQALAALVQGDTEKARDIIISAFEPLLNFFQNLWNNIVGVFRDVGARVGDAIGGAFKAAINAVLSTAERILNNPINAINAVLGILNAIPGVNIGLLPGISLPRMAQGGIVTKPMIAQIGEAGPEAVIPLTQAAGGIGTTYNVYIDGIKYNTDEYIDSSVRGFVQNVFRLGQTFSR